MKAKLSIASATCLWLSLVAAGADFLRTNGRGLHGPFRSRRRVQAHRRLRRKKPVDGCWFSFPYPEGWKETVVAFAEANRTSYHKIYAARPDRALALRLMREFVENCKAAHCTANKGYLEACGMKVPQP